MVKEPIEHLKGAHVQNWIDAVRVDDGDEDGIDAKTVNKKLSGSPNYWHWLNKREVATRPRRLAGCRQLAAAPPGHSVSMI